MSSPPKRDKFAAMSAKASAPQLKPAPAAPSTSNNKLAAMAGATSSRSEGKLAAMSLKQQQQEIEQSQEKLGQRIHQRDGVWEDLDKAEASIIRLLRIARDTVGNLSEAVTGNKLADDEHGEDPHSVLQKLSKDFSGTVGTIHGLLAAHSELVRPYKAPSRINRVYQARVEWRMAEERRSIVRELSRLDAKEDL